LLLLTCNLENMLFSQVLMATRLSVLESLKQATFEMEEKKSRLTTLKSWHETNLKLVKRLLE